MQTLAKGLGLLAVLGLLAHLIGEALPRRWFRAQQFPYRDFFWERQGKVYRKLGVHKWKDLLPDKSRIAKNTYSKKITSLRDPQPINRLVEETCVAEFVHWCLVIISPVFLLISDTWETQLMAALYRLGNLPFIIIQRYNRPRLQQVLHRLQQQGPGKHACCQCAEPLLD